MKDISEEFRATFTAKYKIISNTNNSLLKYTKHFYIYYFFKS